MVKEMDAKIEAMLLHQILEEHTKKDKKNFQPCTECIRLGLNKGFNRGLNESSEAQIR